MSYPDSIWTINDAYWAINNNNIDDLKKSIKNGNFDLNEENEFGETLLGTAIWLKNVEIVKYLCSLKEIDVNKKTKVYLGDEACEHEIVVSPLELAACVLPKIHFGKNAFLDLKSKQVCSELVKRNAKFPLDRYKKDARYFDCLRDLREVVNSVKTTKNKNVNLRNNEK